MSHQGVWLDNCGTLCLLTFSYVNFYFFFVVAVKKYWCGWPPGSNATSVVQHFSSLGYRGSRGARWKVFLRKKCGGHDSMSGVCRNSSKIFRGHAPKDNVVDWLDWTKMNSSAVVEISVSGLPQPIIYLTPAPLLSMVAAVWSCGLFIYIFFTVDIKGTKTRAKYRHSHK